MGIVDEDVARVRAATDFVALAGEHIALKRVGRQWQGLCPFHGEKTPSFSINPELGVFHCFGCGAGGDVITFVRDLEHLTFVEAVERLAAKAGIALRYDDGTDGRDRQRRKQLLDAMEKAVDWYHERLLKAPDAATARGYLRSRGYDGEIVRSFRLGWAPEGWDSLASALRLPNDVLKDTGLGFVNRVQRQQDAFRDRIMFPIFDAAGAAVAFGARILPGGEGPKYKNSQETPIYSKRKVLYGLNWAKGSVVESGEAIVCEGYTDVIGFFTAGLPRAVATCGTALADEHVRLLKNFAPRVVLAYDADTAGQAAAERFYAWEQREQIDISVAAFPSGAGPGDLARNDPAALKQAVEQARPFLAFRIDRIVASADLRTPEGRARAAEAAMAAIREHPNELVRDQYVREVADRCRLDAEQLRRSRVPAGRSERIEPARPAQGGQPRRTADSPALQVLRLCLHQPEDVAAVFDKIGGGLTLDEVAGCLFTDDLLLAAFRSLAAAATLHEAFELADPGAAELLRALAVEDTDADPEDVLALLVRTAAMRTLHELEAEARSADERAVSLTPTVAWLKLAIEELDEPRTRIAAAGRLVPWLVAQGEEDA